MKRREFLKNLGKWGTVFVVPFLSGCLQLPTVENKPEANNNTTTEIQITSNKELINPAKEVFDEIKKKFKGLNKPEDVSENQIGETINYMENSLNPNLHLEENEFKIEGPYIEVTVIPSSPGVEKYAALILLNRYLGSSNWLLFKNKIDGYVKVLKGEAKLSIYFYLLRTYEPDLNIDNLLTSGWGNEYQYMAYVAKELEKRSEGRFHVVFLLVDNKPYVLLVSDQVKDMIFNVVYIPSILNNENVLLFPSAEQIFETEDFEEACKKTKKDLLNRLKGRTTGYAEVFVVTDGQIILKNPYSGKNEVLEDNINGSTEFINDVNQVELDHFLASICPDNISLGTVLEYLWQNGVKINEEEVSSWKKEFEKFMTTFFVQYNGKRLNYVLDILKKLNEVLNKNEEQEKNKKPVLVVQ